MNTFEVIECDTPEKYLHTLSLCNEYWWENSIDCNWIFRGQLSKYPLIPSLYRTDEGKDQHTLVYQKLFDKIQDKLVTGVPDMFK